MPSPILNPIELRALHENEFFYTKAAIDAKISDLFGALKKEIESTLQNTVFGLPPALSATPGRLYRGENLDHLPWRALDCPRLFSKEDMFCFRTLLIWGTSFSFHLLLSGHWLDKYAAKLVEGHASLAASNWNMSLQESPWDWKMDPARYLPINCISQKDFEEKLHNRIWLKISIAYPLDEFERIPDHGARLFATLAQTLR